MKKLVVVGEEGEILRKKDLKQLSPHFLIEFLDKKDLLSKTMWGGKKTKLC